MRARPHAEIGLAVPIFQIVPRGKARPREIGDFILLQADRRERVAYVEVFLRRRFLLCGLPPGERRAWLELEQVG